VAASGAYRVRRAAEGVPDPCRAWMSPDPLPGLKSYCDDRPFRSLRDHQSLDRAHMVRDESGRRAPTRPTGNEGADFIVNHRDGGAISCLESRNSAGWWCDGCRGCGEARWLQRSRLWLALSALERGSSRWTFRRYGRASHHCCHAADCRGRSDPNCLGRATCKYAPITPKSSRSSSGKL
jgi:hypothetical protein